MDTIFPELVTNHLAQSRPCLCDPHVHVHRKILTYCSEYLQSVAALTPVPQSPTYSSTNTSQLTTSPSSPSAQQILIAQLLVSLLSSPHFAMPLNDLKTILAQKTGAEPNLNLPQGTTKVLYVCVAKRLVTIDRGGGKQIVKFDL